MRREQLVRKYSEYFLHLLPLKIAAASSHSAVTMLPKLLETSTMCRSHQHLQQVHIGALINPSAMGLQRFCPQQLVSSILEPPSFSLPLVGVLYSNKTLLIFFSDAFEKYQSATGGTLDANTGLLRITSDQYAQLSSLYFTVGGVTYELTANGQIWPRSLNSAIGGTTDGIYLVVADSETASGSGLDFTNGYCFLYAKLHFARKINC
jgi:hypothetical protein